MHLEVEETSGPWVPQIVDLHEIGGGGVGDSDIGSECSPNQGDEAEAIVGIDKAERVGDVWHDNIAIKIDKHPASDNGVVGQVESYGIIAIRIDHVDCFHQVKG